MPRGRPFLGFVVLEPYKTCCNKAVDPGSGVCISMMKSASLVCGNSLRGGVRGGDEQINDEVIGRARGWCDEHND